MQQRTLRIIAISALTVCSACSPALNWRDVQVEGTLLRAQLPCKPSTHERPLLLSSQALTLTMKSCAAADSTWALAWVKGVDPSEVTELMGSLREAASRNIGAQTGPVVAREIAGATHNTRSGQSRAQGQRPDGTDITQELVLFTHGTTVFQATVLSSKADPEAVEEFFRALRLAP